MVSAVLVNFNEGKKLKEALESLIDFAEELVVVDLGSTDGSEEICKKFGARIFTHAPVPYVELIRDYSISKANGDWVMVLDPDEKIGSKLKEKLRYVIKNDKFTAVNIPRKNIFFGKWISHSNWWPDKHIRFFKKGSVRWGDKIHKYPEVVGPILNLNAEEDLAILHFGYNSINEFINRQDRYSTIEAKNLYDGGLRFSWSLFFWRPFREFLVRFVRHAGFLDGFYGFALVYLMMVYQLEVMIKLWEMEKKR